MTDSNPFQPTQTAADPAKQKTGKRGFEIVHNVLRGLLVFLSIAIIPVFILPNFADMFDEFWSRAANDGTASYAIQSAGFSSLDYIFTTQFFDNRDQSNSASSQFLQKSGKRELM